MVGESNQNVFLIQKDASNSTEFEISEFEIARVDCISLLEEYLIRLPGLVVLWSVFEKLDRPLHCPADIECIIIL